MSVRVESQGPIVPAARDAAHTPLDKMVEEAVDLAMDVVLHTDVVEVPSTGSIDVDPQLIASRLAMITDPQAILFAAQAQLRDTDAATYKEIVKANEVKAEFHHKLKMEMLRKAEKAARKSKKPRFLKKLLSAVMIAVGVVAAAFTGGVALGLAIAGAVLLLAGDHIVNGLVKAGIIPKKAAPWVALALKVVGAALMAVSGNIEGVSNVATSVAQVAGTTVQAVQQTTNTINMIVQVIGAVTNSAIDIRSAYWTKQSADAKANADEAKLDQELAETARDEAVDGFKESFERFNRVSERLARMAEAQGRVRHASTQLLA